MSHINFRGEANIREGLGITPTLGKAVMIDPTAVVMGDVCLGDDVSVWPHAAMRGDVQIIRIGARTNIQDGTVLHVTHDGPYQSRGLPPAHRRGCHSRSPRAATWLHRRQPRFGGYGGNYHGCRCR